jgi:hypothetical protein
LQAMSTVVGIQRGHYLMNPVYLGEIMTLLCTSLALGRYSRNYS